MITSVLVRCGDGGPDIVSDGGDEEEGGVLGMATVMLRTMFAIQSLLGV